MTLVFTSRAKREIRKLSETDRRAIGVALQQLDAGQGDNLNIKALVGHSPYLRLRVGDYRVIYAPAPARSDSRDWEVLRVINRRDLDAAIKQL